MSHFFMVIALLMAGSVTAQKESETIRKTLSFETASTENQLVVHNINGNITVEGHDASTIEVTVVKTISANSGAIRQQGKEEIQLGVVEKETIIALFMESPCTGQNANQWTKDQLQKGAYTQWNHDCKWRPKYDYKLDFTVKVPRGIRLKVSTVNDGDLLVAGMQNGVHANNINGHITLEQIAGPTKVHAINGDVNLSYVRNPEGTNKYYSLNGNIKVNFARALSADVYFESFNGDLYPDFDQVTPLPTKVKQEESKKGKGIKYKLSTNPGVRIRKGDAQLYFETLNGDVYLTEQQ